MSCLAILVARALLQHLAKLEATHVGLALTGPQAQGVERPGHVLDHRSRHRRAALAPGIGARELVVLQRPQQVLAGDHRDVAVVAQRQLNVRVAQEHQRLHPRRLIGVLHLAAQEAAEHLGLVVGQLERVLQIARSWIVGRGSIPVQMVAFVAAWSALDLHQIERRVPQHQQVDLVEPPRRGVEQVEQSPDVVRIAVGELIDREVDRLALVRVGGLALKHDAGAPQGHPATSSRARASSAGSASSELTTRALASPCLGSVAWAVHTRVGLVERSTAPASAPSCR